MFPPDGYITFPLGLTKTTLSALLRQAKRSEYVSVFREVGGGLDDPFRSQSRQQTLSCQLTKLHIKLQVAARVVDDLFIPRVYSFMHSRAGGSKQAAHTDYTPADVQAVQARYPRSIPASAIVALQPSTQLKVYAGCYSVAREDRARLVKIPVGHCIIFRGDLIHAGAVYSRANYRLHCYLQFEGVQWVPDIVMGAGVPSFKCQFCGKSDSSSTRMRNHRFYCLSNPDGLRNRETRQRLQNTRGTYTCSDCGKSYPVKSSLRSHRNRKHSSSAKVNQNEIKY
ncbi:unnamed protein product [Phytophthora fragariaefolia]|uniref:Unnamed protein product n=1 Tax=Phytophthora fragariaefolia TaxID=1490495 RepID=A0A9W6XQU3_9STRA|nr:unnamed protein product [Phytophthora fragariaefolia]